MGRWILLLLSVLLAGTAVAGSARTRRKKARLRKERIERRDQAAAQRIRSDRKAKLELARQDRSYRLGALKVNVVHGDITQVPAEGLLTTAYFHKETMSFLWPETGVGYSIRYTSGNRYHTAIERALKYDKPLHDGQMIKAYGWRSAAGHRGRFADVVFIVDRLRKPLDGLVKEAMAHADQVGYSTVSLPALRLDKHSEQPTRGVEKTVLQVAQRLAEGLKQHDQAKGDSSRVKEVSLVVFGDVPAFGHMLNSALKRAGAVLEPE